MEKGPGGFADKVRETLGIKSPEEREKAGLLQKIEELRKKIEKKLRWESEVRRKNPEESMLYIRTTIRPEIDKLVEELEPLIKTAKEKYNMDLKSTKDILEGFY